MLHGVVADRGAKGDHPLPLRILSGGMALLPSCKALSCCMAAGLLAGTGFDLRKLCYLHVLPVVGRALGITDSLTEPLGITDSEA